MPEEIYVQAIALLLPLTACMVVTQVNPYHALVIRGILGAVAALVYALFGAADVALTEALVGTMLSITLYAIAVRSSLRLRLGVIEQDWKEGLVTEETSSQLLLSSLRKTLSQYHMRLELVSYPHSDSLHQALITKDVHMVCALSHSAAVTLPDTVSTTPPFHLQTRVRRLYDLCQSDLPAHLAQLDYVMFEAHPDSAKMPTPVEE